MSIERFILVFSVLLCLASILYIPKSSLRKAFLSHLAFQMTTWVISIILKEAGMVSYPVREFVRATNVNFIFEFVILPCIFTWFMLLYPENKHFLLKTAHWALFISLPVLFIVFIAQYTNLYKFTKGLTLMSAINTFMMFSFQFGICYVYISWFFRNPSIYKKGT